MRHEPAMSGEWTAVAVANLGEVIPSLVAAYVVVLGAVALVTGWQWLQGRGPVGDGAVLRSLRWASPSATPTAKATAVCDDSECAGVPLGG